MYCGIVFSVMYYAVYMNMHQRIFFEKSIWKLVEWLVLVFHYVM